MNRCEANPNCELNTLETSIDCEHLRNRVLSALNKNGELPIKIEVSQDPGRFFLWFLAFKINIFEDIYAPTFITAHCTYPMAVLCSSIFRHSMKIALRNWSSKFWSKFWLKFIIFPMKLKFMKFLMMNKFLKISTLLNNISFNQWNLLFYFV